MQDYNANGAITEIKEGWIPKTAETFEYTSYSNMLKEFTKHDASYGFAQGSDPLTQKDSIMQWRYRYGAFGNLEQKRLYRSDFGDEGNNYHKWEYNLTGLMGTHAIYNGVQHHNGTDRKVHMFVEKYLVNGGEVTIDKDFNRSISITDNIGNVRLVVRDSANYHIGYEHYDQTPFGDSTLTYSGKGARFSYGAKELNPENGYFKMGARLYDPKIGRFLSRDPLAELFPNHSSYSYAFNSPMNFNDPTGLAPETEKGDKLQGGWELIQFFDMLAIETGISVVAGLPPGVEASKDEGARTGSLIERSEQNGDNASLDVIRNLAAAQKQATQVRMAREKAKLLKETERKRAGDDSALRDFLMERGRSGSDNTRTTTHINYNPLGAVRDNSPTVGSQSKFSPENLSRNNRSQSVDPSKSDALDAAMSGPLNYPEKMYIEEKNFGAYLQLEGVGVTGSYRAQFHASVFEQNGSFYVNVSASGVAPAASQISRVSFDGKAELMDGSNVIGEQGLNQSASPETLIQSGWGFAGSTSFLLPTSSVDNVSVRFSISYSASNENGTARPNYPSLSSPWYGQYSIMIGFRYSKYP